MSFETVVRRFPLLRRALPFGSDWSAEPPHTPWPFSQPQSPQRIAGAGWAEKLGQKWRSSAKNRIDKAKGVRARYLFVVPRAFHTGARLFVAKSDRARRGALGCPVRRPGQGKRRDYILLLVARPAAGRLTKSRHRRLRFALLGRKVIPLAEYPFLVQLSGHSNLASAPQTQDCTLRHPGPRSSTPLTRRARPRVSPGQLGGSSQRT
jgi:hypothetical protein